MKNFKIRKIEISVLIGLITAIVLCFLNCVANSDEISKNVLRLHILANSNSKKDQNLKLKVRDEILKTFNFNGFNNDLEKSKKQIENSLGEIESVAKKVIEKEGFSYPVKASIEKTYFKTREYDTFAMPAGVYEALKIKIGNAKGENWWCVLVPSLCVPAANKKNYAIETFNSQEKDLIEKGSKTEIRFATIELFKKLFS